MKKLFVMILIAREQLPRMLTCPPMTDSPTELTTLSPACRTIVIAMRWGKFCVVNHRKETDGINAFILPTRYASHLPTLY